MVLSCKLSLILTFPVLQRDRSNTKIFWRLEHRLFSPFQSKLVWILPLSCTELEIKSPSSLGRRNLIHCFFQSESASNAFRSHFSPNKFENAIVNSFFFILYLCLRKTHLGKSHFLRFQNVVCLHQNASRSFAFKSIFEKLRFRDGLVWTGSGPTRMKLRFKI